jgi:hypothetical protein
MDVARRNLMILKIKLSALKNTSWPEYALRFVLGGLATVCTGLIADEYGPVTGGLFLAFPAICCASVTLVEKHEQKRKQKAGLPGSRRGQEAAALESAGVALGSVGLLMFAATVWGLLVSVGTAYAFTGASAAWLLVSISLWWMRRFMRRPSR